MIIVKFAMGVIVKHIFFWLYILFISYKIKMNKKDNQLKKKYKIKKSINFLIKILKTIFVIININKKIDVFTPFKKIN